MKRTIAGTPKRLTIEVGPWSHYCFTKAEIAKRDREIRDDLDALVRRYFLVGPYSKTVRTRMEDA